MFQSGAFYVVALVFGYLLGSIPFGLILTRLAGLGDIRTIGSGNIGATNVLRTGNKGVAAATLILDALKGAAAVLLAGGVAQEFGPIAGLGAFLGHIFPVWLNFKGGKGVSTYIGVLAALSWIAALVFAAVWLATAAITRYSSASGLLASLIAPVVAWFTAGPSVAIVLALMTAILWWRHETNIRRLLAGTEGRIGDRR